MENLESHIVNKLKTLLINYDMNLDIGPDNEVLFNSTGVLFNSTDLVLYHNKESDTGVYFWTSINDMLFSKDNIFYILYKYFNFPKYICQCSSTSLEELVINMDLMGV
jgi:hypothetical protein